MSPVLLCRNVFIILSSSFLIPSIYSCSYEEPCLGGRPAGPSYCCPIPPGKECEGGEGLEHCDTELGYICEGPAGNKTCQGSFGLAVHSINYTSVRLTWRPVAPPGYTMEYSLLRTRNLTENVTDWLRTEVGIEPQHEVIDLLPGTYYFFRIGLWHTYGFYQNLSEISMVETLDGCRFKDEMINVGDERTDGCETDCTCRSGDSLDCREVCEGVVAMAQGPSVTCSSVPAGEEYPECCKRLICVPSDGHCDGLNGTLYNNNTRYNTACQTCQCLNGEIDCLDREECQSPEELQCHPLIQQTPLPGDCCSRFECPKGCMEGDVTYEHGDQVTRGCNEVCLCGNGEVICEEICPRIDLQPSEECSYPSLSYPSGDRCPSKDCLETPPTCSFNGADRDIGVRYTDTFCQTCQCHSQYDVSCQPGCFDDLTHIPRHLACPEPQLVQLDGQCCPQVWCRGISERTDTTSLIEPMVFWVENDVVIVQFNILNEDALDGFVVGYEIEFTNSSDSDVWDNKFIRKEDIQNRTELSISSYPHNTEVYNGTWMTNNVINIPLTGLNPTQTYYIQVTARLGWQELPLSSTEGFLSENTSSPPGFFPDPPRAPVSPTIVAPSLVSYKCHVKQRVLQHGEQFQDGCDLICTCSYGRLSCSPVCPEKQEFCPRPSEEIPSDSCCGRTKCFGKPGCCPYGNTTIQDGDTIRERCERFCRCENGSLNCWPVCSNPQPPRQGCKQIYYEDHCCPTWQCPSEQKPPSSIVTTLILRLAGVCPNEGGNFTSLLINNIIKMLRAKELCPETQSGNRIVVCQSSQFTVICPRFTTSLRQKRGVGGAAISVVIKVQAINHFAETNTAALEVDLSRVVERIELVFSKPGPVSVGNWTYPFISGVGVRGTTVQCDEGYIRHARGCMAGRIISSNRSVSYHVIMKTVDVTESTATLHWKGLPHVELNYLEEIMLEYRDISANGSWVSTHKLHSSATLYVLQSLSPATLYVVRLILLTTSLGVNKYTAATSTFQTNHGIAPIPEVKRPEITGMEVSLTSVTIRWNIFTESRYIQHVFVAFQKVPKDNKHVIQFLRTDSLDSRTTEYTIRRLSPDTIYKVKVGLVLSNETTVFSLIADVRTKCLNVPDKGSDLASHRAVIYGVSTVAILAVGALIAIFVCIFRKSRGSSRLSSASSDTNFENKMFDMETKSNGTWRE